VSPALYLIDTSGLFRILQDKLRQAWAGELAAGVIAICPVVELEFLYSARSLADRLEKQRLLRTVFGWVPMAERAYDRAAAVQQLLTETGKHRSAGPVDLLIAATAEQQDLTVLCDDRDFETVASVTRQRVRLVTDIPDNREDEAPRQPSPNFPPLWTERGAGLRRRAVIWCCLTTGARDGGKRRGVRRRAAGRVWGW
jgi:predicted nucleic acid-binding protein